jgi:hypothetical protein
MNAILAKLKVLIVKAEGGISFTKVWAWITGLISTVVALQGQLGAIGVSIPAHLLPWFKVAAIASAVITAIRARNAASGDVSAPDAPATPAAPAAPTAPASK